MEPGNFFDPMTPVPCLSYISTTTDVVASISSVAQFTVIFSADNYSMPIYLYP
jgi:hypothetical protein